MKKNLIKIELDVYDYSMEVTIDKDQKDEYEAAALRATDRFAAYLKSYKDKMDERTILLMTLVDLAVLSYKDYSENGEKIPIKLHVCDETLSLSVKMWELHLYNSAAEFITNQYERYRLQYADKKDTVELSRMLLFDIALKYKDWGLDNLDIEVNDNPPK